MRNAIGNRIRGAVGTVAATPLTVMAYGDDGLDKMPGLAPEAVASRGATGWGNVFGSWNSVDGTTNAAGVDHSTGGVVAGIDGMLDTWRVGMLAGYSHTSFDVDDRASSGSADSFHLGVYGGTQWGAVGLRTGLAYT